MLNKYRAKLIEKTQLAHDVYSFKFRLEDAQELNFLAGQYLIFDVPQIGSDALKRIYSIASSSNEKTGFLILLKIIHQGKASLYLSNLQLGDLVDFSGPAGIFTLKEANNNLAFLATGTGIAPILSILTSNQRLIVNRKIQLFWGLPTKSDVYLLGELKDLKSKNPNFDFKICLSQEKNLDGIGEEERQYFSLGRINLVLKINNNTDYYLCGSPAVVDSLKNHLTGNGVKKESVYFEKF